MMSNKETGANRCRNADRQPDAYLQEGAIWLDQRTVFMLAAAEEQDRSTSRCSKEPGDCGVRSVVSDPDSELPGFCFPSKGVFPFSTFQ
jgi:hypothetical protein